MKKAIDIVILPPAEITEQAMRYSEQVKNAANIRLNNSDQLPHITLLMGGIDEEAIPTFWDSTLAVINGTKPFEVNIAEVRIKSSYTGLHSERSPELMRLHLALVDNLMSQLAYDLDLNAFAHPSTTQEKSLKWVNGFRANSIRENYNPHITLADGKLADISDIELPQKFVADRIALCQLGNYCTCESVLFEHQLS